METTLVVLAAGIGSRYGGLKQLEKVGPGGETLLEYSIFDARDAGFDHVVLVIRSETESAFRQALAIPLADGMVLSTVHQELADLPTGITLPGERHKPWGTGHAVLSVRHEVADPFAVINADDFYGRDAFVTLRAFLTNPPPGPPPTFAAAGFKLGPTLSDAGPVSRGLCRVDSDGWLERIVEVPALAKNGRGGRYTDRAGREHTVSADELVSMNMWGFTPAVFDELRIRFREFLETLNRSKDGAAEFLLPDVVQSMIKDGCARVRVLRHDGRWCGITFPEDREQVRAFIAERVAGGEYPQRLWG